MGLAKFLYWFGASGLLIPALFSVFWQILRTLGVNAVWILHVEKIQLLLWPSSIFMIATAGSPFFSFSLLSIFLISSAVNVIVYLFFGGLIWLGLIRYMIFLYIVPVLILVGWITLLSL